MIKLALIGCGYWGKNHLRTLSELENVDLAYVCDTRGILPGIKIPNNSRFVTDYQKVVHDPAVQGAIISTPTATHYSLAKVFLNAGISVFIEKPLATGVSEAQDLCSTAKKNNKVLMVGEIFRFNPAVNYVQELIKSGELGELRYLESRRVGLGPVRNDVSALWDLATHDIYLSHLFIGKNPSAVRYSGISHNGKLDDIVCINLRYEHPKVLSTIYVNWEHPIKERVFIIGGTKKAIKFDDVQPAEKIAIFERSVDYSPQTGDFGEFQSSIRSGNTVIPSIKIKQPLEEELKHFLGCISNNTTCLSSGYDGVETVKVLEAAEESKRNYGQEIKLK